MARGMVGASPRERDLARHVEAEWGPARKERAFKRLAIVVAIVLIIIISLFLGTLLSSTDVEERYVVSLSAYTELYIGQLQLSPSAWVDLLDETTITMQVTIPAWKVNLTKELTYFNRTVDGARLDYLRVPPITSQVDRETSGKRVDFEVRIKIVTPHPEIAKLKFLGKGNSFTGTVTNHPDKPLLELTSDTGGVRLVGDDRVEVRNEPKRDDVEYWFLQFRRTRLS